ncbi:hypothetical protein ANCCAN_25975 [Ancylostoma caninum]|uniref:PABS domain-containing protein n=1 Tax=Ancylostoma caninum TaxID=29170 RepID=A0A368F7Z0_ANCCA|nr:hypothetical protein ANCCAN_25975 [Ancylostoma caninum]
MPGQKLNITIVDIDPVMKRIAEKWYGFKETDMHRIIIEDGVEFIKKASDQEVKYDAILLDLCTNERKPLLCPIEPFLKDDAISNLSYNLAETGMCTPFFIQLLFATSKIMFILQVLKRFEEHFPFCVLLPSGSYDRVSSANSNLTAVLPSICDAILGTAEKREEKMKNIHSYNL